MSKKILIFFIAIILLNTVNAVDFKFFKDKYMAGDSVQAWIDFENLSLVNPFGYSNIKLYDGTNKIPLNLNLYKIDGNYFVYFILPELEARDYNFVLENILYSEKNKLTKGKFISNLTLIDGHGISITPALIYLNIESWENPRITFEIKNKAMENINLSFESASEYINFNKENYILKKDETYLLSMIISMKNYPNDKFNSELVIKYLNSSYNIPIIVNKPSSGIISSGGKINENIISEGELKVVENADSVERYLREQDSLEGPFRFKNSGNKTLYGLSFELTNNLDKIMRYKYDGDYILEPDEQESVYLYINENKDINRNYSGDLIIKSESQQIKFPFSINYIPEGAAANQTAPASVNETFYYNYTKMPEPTKKSNTFVYILLGIFFIILIYLIYYFYKKGKSENKKFDSLIPTFSKQ